jgi:CheY-like chemotaxis protein
MLLLQGKRIFIVEDNVENKAIMQLLLEQAGAVTAFERWGQTTVKRLEIFSPVDLILMDLMFPGGVTGYQIAADVRKVESLKNIPIVAVSASDAATEIPKAQAAGFVGYIPKPIDFRSFQHQVASILNGTPLWASG